MSKRTLIIIGVAIAVAVPLLVQSLRHVQQQSVLNRQAEVDARNQSEFLDVKQGRDTALVLDSGLLPLLASDDTCIANLAELDLSTVEPVDPIDAQSVAKFSNLKRMYFYCAVGADAVLEHAAGLPIETISFEGTDLSDASLRRLAEFPSLKQAHFAWKLSDEQQAIVDALPDRIEVKVGE